MVIAVSQNNFLIPECDIFTFELTYSFDLEHSEVEGHLKKSVVAQSEYSKLAFLNTF